MTDESTNQFPPLVVGVNRKGVRAIYLPIQIMLMIGIPVTGFIAVWATTMVAEYQSTGAAMSWGSLLIGLSVLLSYCAMYLVRAGTKAMQADDFLTLNATGLAMNIPNGKLALPWSAIGAVQRKMSWANELPLSTWQKG